VKNRDLEDALTLHTIPIAGRVAGAGVPLRGVTVHVLLAWLDPSDRPFVGIVALPPLGRTALRESLRDVDVHTAQRVDHGGEAVHVDEDVVRDLYPENPLRSILRRLDPGSRPMGC